MMYLQRLYGAGGGAIRSISENSLAAATARINIAVCLISCLADKDINIKFYQKYELLHIATLLFACFF